MYEGLFNDFLESGDTLWVYKRDELVFSSSQDMLLPLLEYIDTTAQEDEQVVIFDMVSGNAAALLSVQANCREVYSPLGSQLAIETLDKYGVEYHFSEIVPYIQRPDSERMCPMEELSIDKEPGQFYEILKSSIKLASRED